MISAMIMGNSMKLEHSTAGHAVPTFSIFDPATGDRIETLKHCHMGRATIDMDNPPAVIKADDGWVYTAAYDSRFPEKVKKVDVIISFQAHTYGRFAVIRTVNDTANSDKNRKE